MLGAYPALQQWFLPDAYHKAALITRTIRELEAIREALAYFEANPEVIALDHATEMYLLSLKGAKAVALNL